MERGARVIGGKRSEVDILLDVLTLALEGERRTRIMHRANLSYTMLNRYLGFLEARGYMRARSDGGYLVTDAGHRFITDLLRVQRHFRPPASPLDAP